MMGFLVILFCGQYFGKDEKHMSLRGNFYGLLGYLNHSKKKYSEAEKYYREAVELGMTKGNYKLSYGVLLLNRGKFEEAKELFSKVLIDYSQTEKTRTRAKMNLALAYWKLGDVDTAIEMLMELQLKFNTSRIYGSLGYMLIEKGDLERALEYNLEALDYDDEDPVILDNLAQTYYEMNEIEQAKELFLKVEEIKPDQVTTLYYLACIYEREGNRALALEKLSRALECDITPLSTISRQEIQGKFDELQAINS